LSIETYKNIHNHPEGESKQVKATTAFTFSVETRELDNLYMYYTD